MDKFANKYLKKLRIGNLLLDNNVLMAPLSGYSCFPFRIMCRKLGAALAYTEMVSVNGLKYNDAATQKLLFTTGLETPKAVQLLGSEPNMFEYTCKSELMQSFDVIDINMGCPVPNVIKSGQGCALMAQPFKATKIIEACKRSGKIVTVKFRLGLTDNSIIAAEFAKLCENAGADMITIHGRTRNMMYAGETKLEHIAAAKSAVKIPVIANGGIFSEEDAIQTMKQTGADGIMIARYGIENPLIFSQLTGKETTQSKYHILMEQMHLTSQYFDELYTLNYIKKLTSFFMKKQSGTKQYKQSLYQCGNTEELKSVIGNIFPKKAG